jgi:hypothetical protein
MSKITEAQRLAREGYGFQDLMVKLGLSEDDARYLVFGREAFMRWKAKQPFRKVAS